MKASESRSQALQNTQSSNYQNFGGLITLKICQKQNNHVNNSAKNHHSAVLDSGAHFDVSGHE